MMHRITSAILATMYAGRRAAAVLKRVAVNAHVVAHSRRVERADERAQDALRIRDRIDLMVEQRQREANEIHVEAVRDLARHGVDIA